MKPELFAALPTTTDGRPVVTLMSDPDISDGFLSLVDKGANGRRIAVAKADELAPGGASSPATEIIEDVGQRAAGIGFWRKLFGGILFGQPVAKMDGKPMTFDAAIACTKLHEARWQATDALWQVIHAVLEDSEIADKVAPIGSALDQFKAHVLGLVAATPVAKAEDRVIALKSLRDAVAKEGRVLSTASLGKITAAEEALASALAALKALHEAAAKAAADSPHTEDDPMKLDATQLSAVAEAAAAVAVKVAKAAGITDAAKLQEIGGAASMDVFKAAVQGPPQPGLPTDALAKQLGMAGPTEGSHPTPEAHILPVLTRLGAMVAKIDETLHGKPAVVADAAKGIAAAPAEPGLRDVVEKHGELLGATIERVSKIASTPRAPIAGGEQPREAVRKQDGEIGNAFAGTALSFADKPAAS